MNLVSEMKDILSLSTLNAYIEAERIESCIAKVCLRKKKNEKAKKHSFRAIIYGQMVLYMQEEMNNGASENEAYHLSLSKFDK